MTPTCWATLVRVRSLFFFFRFSTWGNESLKTTQLPYCVTLSASSLKLYTFSWFTQLNFIKKGLKKKKAGLIFLTLPISTTETPSGGGRGAGRSAAQSWLHFSIRTDFASLACHTFPESRQRTQCCRRWSNGEIRGEIWRLKASPISASSNCRVDESSCHKFESKQNKRKKKKKDELTLGVSYRCVHDPLSMCSRLRP